MLVRKNTPFDVADNWLKKTLNAENLIVLSVIGLPFYLVKLDFFGIPTNILDLLQAAAIFWWYFDKKSKKPAIQEVVEKYGKYLVAIGLLFFGLVTSLIVNGNYSIGLGIIKSWFLLPALFAFAAVNVIDTDEKIENILSVFYFSSVVVSLIGLVYYFFGRLTYDGRLEAFFNSPNYLAMYLSPAVIIGTILAQSKNLKVKIRNNATRSKAICYASLVVVLVSLYLTRSYAAWIAVAVSLAIARIVVRGKSIFKSKFFWISVILTLLFFSAQWNSGKMRDAYTFSERSSLSSRLMIWKAASKQITDNPIWGIGPGNFQNKYLEYQKFFPPYLEWAVPHPHNIFLAFFLYSGLIGFVGFLWLSFLWFRTVMAKENSHIKLVFLSLMVCIFIHGLVDTTYFKNDLAVLFWLNFLALNLKKPSEEAF